MPRYVVLALTVSLIVLLAGCGSAASPTVATAPDAVQTNVGTEFKIALESNPTTGYQWEADFDKAALSLVGQKYDSSSSLVGAGGTDTWTLKATKAGTFKITFSYKRSWGKDPIKSHVVTVTAK